MGLNAFGAERLCKADSGRMKGCFAVSLRGATGTSSLLFGRLDESFPKN